MARRNAEFQTIRSEGGLLPPDLLRRVLNPKENLPGTRPEDYSLLHGERLNDFITSSWNRLRKHWAEFCEASAELPDNKAGTGLTNGRWTLPLLRELGFGLLPTSPGPKIGGRTYAINRFFGPIPVHLVGCLVNLDRRAAGVRGAAAANPHGLVQEYLNRSDQHLWAVVSNGLRFRVLRDNQALSRQLLLEFDLEAMFSGEVYSDFVLFWLVAHGTRFAPREAERPETCWLEKWTQDAEKQGTRALGELRGGVEQALAVLGKGFATHQKNVEIRNALRTGQLSPTELHAQLLRVVYRLIFLFVAEGRTLDGRSLLHPLDDSDIAQIARGRYSDHYSSVRLREMAGRIKGSRHGDLWKQFQILVSALSGSAEYETIRYQLALPALGSFLWDPASTSALNDAELTNFDLLETLRHLAFTRRGKVLRPVDYKNLGAEELGGVYESLLALTPQVSGDGAGFYFAEFAGNERRATGSYYTPDSLVQCLLDSALDPVVEEAIRGKVPAEAEEAILTLKVCDPAVGSGHFLVGAARRLARHLARVRALAEGESEPSPLLYQQALRDVIGRCLYGVDINPMAAELCRVSLWLEALEPGRPLSFLDHHIRVGNSLLGTTPVLMAGGLPDNAFKPIEGDDKKICAALKKRNKGERAGQRDFGLQMEAETQNQYETLALNSQNIDQAPDDSLESIQHKEDQFHRLVVSPEYRCQQQIADAWCAAFVWEKKIDAPEPITTDTLRRLEEDINALNSKQRDELERLVRQYQFFHWHLAFPEVFARSGFDCVLGNPPWENLQTDPREYFAASAPSIAAAANMAQRNRLIARLAQSDLELYLSFMEEKRRDERIRQLVRASGCYPLTTYGRLNTYALFAELATNIIQSPACLGLVLPVGIATDAFNQKFFRDIVRRERLVSIFGFENEEFIFPEVHHSTKFALITIGSDGQCNSPELVFSLRSVGDLSQSDSRYRMAVTDFELINPNTVTCPVFRRRQDAMLTALIYRRLPVILRKDPHCNPWDVKCQLMFMMNTVSEIAIEADSATGSPAGQLVSNAIDGLAPLIEGKMFHQFDHRFGTYEGQTAAQANQRKLPEFTSDDHVNPYKDVKPRYWLPESVVYEALGDFSGMGWFISWRSVTSVVSYRTVIASILPFSATNDSASLIHLASKDAADGCVLVACLNSFVLDFVARQKLGGNSLRFFSFYQLPIIPRATAEGTCRWISGRTRLTDWLLPRIVELVFSAWSIRSFARDAGWDGPPFRWDEERRFLIRCELDAAFFHLYLPADESGDWIPARKADGCPYDETTEQLDEPKRHFSTPRDAVDYIMKAFPIVHRRDEEVCGEYRTKRVILETYDLMQEAIRTGQPYQTRLDPAPGPPLNTDGKFVSYREIAANPPLHIHLPRDAVSPVPPSC